MNRPGDLTRKAAASLVVGLMVALSVAIPVMECGALRSELTLEGEHDLTRCADTHDHRICTQMGVNVSLVPDESRGPAEGGLVSIEPPSGVEAAWTRTPDEGSRSRAPPRV